MDEGSLTGNKQSTAPSPDIVNPINKTYPTPSSSSSNQGTTATTATAAASKCRLLWRGKFIQDRNGYSGIAIVAHLFAVPSLLSPAHAAHAVHAGPSPFDDPSSAFDTTAATDLCLGLEMMKGQDLKVLGQVYVNAPNDPSTANARHQALQQSKGKMRMELEEVRVETPTDVRVYVDQRCSETVNWLEKAFCDSDRLGIGMRLDLAGMPSVSSLNSSLSLMAIATDHVRHCGFSRRGSHHLRRLSAFTQDHRSTRTETSSYSVVRTSRSNSRSETSSRRSFTSRCVFTFVLSRMTHRLRLTARQ